MRHPNSRAERRAVRDAFIARRRFIRQHIWQIDELWHEGKPEYQRAWTPFCEWGRYSKWNLCCTCGMCQWQKINERRARRAALDQAIIDNLRSWE